MEEAAGHLEHNLFVRTLRDRRLEPASRSRGGTLVPFKPLRAVEEIRERVCQRVCRAVKHFLSDRNVRLVDRHRVVPDKCLGNGLRDPGLVQERRGDTAQGMERQLTGDTRAPAPGLCGSA
jgi:hypothetical protein